MLSNSLQSTWDTQRMKQRAKNGFDDESKYGGGITEEKSFININKTLSAPYRQNDHYSSNNGPTNNELPNLKIPQISMNRMNLNMTMSTQNPQQGLLGSTLTPMNNQNGGTSPRRASNELKKYRASSRQTNSSHRNGRRKYENLGSTAEGGMVVPKPILGTFPSNGGNEPAGLFPQINPQNNHAMPTMNMPRTAQKKYDPINTNIGGPGHNGAPSPTHINLKDTYAGVTQEEHNFAGVTSVRGLKPGNPNWINQDNFFIMENFDSKDTRIYCVLDGHGENGHHVSRRSRENFPHFIVSNNLRMDASFNMMHNDLCSSDIDVRCSGATCVLAYMQGNRLIVYNCGDSRCVLGRKGTNGSITAVPMSNDHKPDKPEERKRILNAGGHLGCRQVLVNQGNRGPVSMPVGPCRVWYQHRGETLGLAMSRSLGDSIVHKFGVACEPEAIEHIIDDMDEFIILATDGVWDVVDNNHAVQMVHNFSMRSPSWNPLEAASCVVKFARSRWEKLSPMIDDITCIVVKVHR